jgi:hypothetical protein
VSTSKALPSFIVIFLLLMLIISTIALSQIPAFAQIQNQNFNLTQSEVAKAPTELSGTDFEKALNLAQSDPRFKQLVAGRLYEYLSYGFVGNVSQHPTAWYPSIVFKVGDKDEIVAIVDLKAEVVKDVQYAPGAYVNIGSANLGGDSSGTTMQYFGNMIIIAEIAAVAIGASIGGYVLLVRFKKGKTRLITD